MLYPKNKKTFDKELFKNPTAEYRCTPFWAWNCDLKEEELLYEIEKMKEMGMGGYHLHCRVGMSTTYLSDEFMSLVKACNEKSKQENMLTWLYDEDKWPSGFAGGYVTKQPQHRQKFLYFTPYPLPEDAAFTKIEGENSSAMVSDHGADCSLLAKYDITLDAEGKLASYKRLETGDSGENIWYAYLEHAKPSPWFNLQTYVDTLSKPAIEEFVKITHQRYKEVLGDEFGKSVPAIFTDEPQVTRKKCLNFGTQKTNVVLPFTADLTDSYKKTYGEDILDKLPEVIWELPQGVSQTRYRYHDHVTERFISAFCDTVGDWCRKNGIYATGHMMEEPTLHSQTVAIGEAMRAYRSLTLPGVDMLCDWREYTTVKQAASATHQYGYPGVTSELYGVTNWDFDFRGHKLQGDWQAALGVSVRVPHLYWVSMRGEAKRDYPASIGHQSSWHPEYSFIEDHFARVNTVMTRGKADIRIGVIHPIESYWLHYGPNDQTLGLRNEMDKRFSNITEWLLFDTLDFDFICESTLPIQYKKSESGFQMGEMNYDAVVVPYCETIRSTTLDALKEFAARGGKIIFMGEAPTLVDALPSEEPKALAESCVSIGWSKAELVAALEPYRTVKIQTTGGSSADGLIYGMRDEDGKKHLFICHGRTCSRGSNPSEEHYIITVKGEYVPTLMNTENGEIADIYAKYENGNTVLEWNCYSQSSILLTLTEGRAHTAPAAKATLGKRSFYRGECEITLHEPNVLVLDMFKWQIDDGRWWTKAEAIRIADMAKHELKLSGATRWGTQPWVFNAPAPANTVTVETSVFSEVEVEGCELALENLEDTEIWINGQPLQKNCTGWYVDHAIKKVSLGTLHAGETVITLKLPFSVISNIENIFVLGDFGVRVTGDYACITAPVRTARFGDLCHQGMPFYGGPITYRMKISGGADTSVSLGLFAAPAVVASVDGEYKGNISLAPHTARLGVLPAGEHTLELKVYLSRTNTFGPLHNCNRDFKWYGPGAWRPSENDYTYEYILREQGLITAPSIWKKD